MRYKTILTITFIVSFSACVFFADASGIKYEYPETTALVQLVEEAVKLLEQDGEKTFFQFNTKGSKWFTGDTFIEVIDSSGIRYVDPTDLARMGKNEYTLRDQDGKQFIKWVIEDLNTPNKDSTWIHYLWPRPGSNTPEWKSTYFKKAFARSGRVYFVGAGIYNPRTEKLFVVDTLNAAIDNTRKRGISSFSQFRDKSSRFVYKDVYIFLISEDGVHLVDPIFSNLEGKNTLELKDIKGKYFVKEFIEKANYDKIEWIDHIYPYPVTRLPSRKSTCVKKINIENIPYIIGSGFYQ